jgi:hypothetical protein
MRILAILLVSCVSTHVLARSAKRAHHLQVDDGYHNALAAADRFLHAWQIQDHETGIMMLSDEARQRVSNEQLDEFFSPGPGAAYEIERGRRIGSNQYAFPIMLFDQKGRSSLPRSCRIVLSKAGKDDWTVKKLP